MIIVRYGEIGLKSPQTRRVMEQRLVENIKTVVGGKPIRRERGRIYIESGSREDAERVARVFGVVSTSVAVKTTSDAETLISDAVIQAKKVIDEKTKFAVRARRKGSHPYKSMEIAGMIGAEIKDATGATVDLTNPDVTIHVEIRDKAAYIFHEIIAGVGGMPLGTQGRVVALVSGGIDSPVAAWMMMKRGVEVVALFMDCRPLVDDRTIDRAMDAVQVLSKWTNKPVKTIVAPYGEALMEFLKYGDHKLGCVLCKRLMLRVAEKVAESEDALGVVTGDSLGQVASQTLQNMNTIETGVDLPVFRPLIGMDKTEIISLARIVGSYETSVQPANCCLGPPLHPETGATVSKVKQAEDVLDMDRLVKETLENLKTLEVSYVEG
ncbi:putative tRNA sulfurtransferase [archaeon BMS3Abin16]|nr:putative tRNA sulfurtransferase [archaeon BMS3Abin16]